MKIKPLNDIVQLKIEEVKAGVLDTSSRESAVEYAEVVEVGENVYDLASGDKVFVKAWGVDIVNYEDKKYHFVNINTNAILAVVKQNEVQ
jgi:co-chaperonin GroES (HSP10)